MANHPAKSTTAPSQTGPAQNQPVAPELPRLLIIDDDEGVRAAVKVISQIEFQVYTASSGETGLKFLRDQPVDVITLDLDLGDMNGIRVLEQIKQINPLIEVIILTGHATLETAREALQLGAFGYLTKPFQTQECRTCLRKALDRRRQMLAWKSLEFELEKRQVEQDIARTKSEIYATVIHDLNTPLTTATGLVELMLMDFDAAGDKGNVSQQLRDVSHQLRFCTDIIKRYLGFMRRTPGQAARAELADVLTDLKKLIRTHAAVKQHRLLVHVPDEQHTVAVNGLDLLQVLLNMTVNALQASEQNHHVEVYCRHWPGGSNAHSLGQGPNDYYLFSERLTAGNSMVSVTVQDDGSGIPAESLPKVFDSFHTTKSTGQGTGLGLTVIHRIVDENKGALHVRSVVGEGTAFTVFFPLI